MNHNKENIIPGDVVRLDKEFRNTSLVVVESLTPHGMYSRVYPLEITKPTEDDHWEVMTYRLTKDLSVQSRMNFDKVTEWGTYDVWRNKNLNVLSSDYDGLKQNEKSDGKSFEEYCKDRWAKMP